MNSIKNDESWQWTPALSIGVPAIDSDHKQLFLLLHEAYLLSETGSSASLLYNLAEELALYTESHFKREEAIMVASAYPFCENHFEAHRTLVNKVQQTLQKTKAGEVSVAEFITFLKDWFINHIQGADQGIAAYAKGFETEIHEALASAGPLTLSQNVNIYIVDDERAQIEMMTEMIDFVGLSSRAFTSAQMFLDQRISNHDIVLLDLSMPDLDGIEVMRTLYGRGCVPTYVLISGFDERVLHSAKKFADSKGISVAKTFTKPLDTRHFIQYMEHLYTKQKLLADKKTVNMSATKKQESSQTPLLLSELKTALEERQLVLFYQPQMEIRTGKFHGLEALVRLQHPERGVIFPEQFIPLAEKHRLMSSLTEEVFRQATLDYSRFLETAIVPKISINISAQNLLDLSLPERLYTKFKEKNIPPESIMIELTETALLGSVSDSLDILNRLRMKGFSLSIDDFGTGYSSLKQLYQAPFSELKIDRQFTMNMLKEDEALSIVKICILLAKELKMKTVAEGVETQEIWNELEAIGCDIAQGYLISKPLPVDECCSWIMKL